VDDGICCRPGDVEMAVGVTNEILTFDGAKPTRTVKYHGNGVVCFRSFSLSLSSVRSGKMIIRPVGDGRG
jgi:hypothetical protein